MNTKISHITCCQSRLSGFVPLPLSELVEESSSSGGGDDGDDAYGSKYDASGSKYDDDMTTSQ